MQKVGSNLVLIGMPGAGKSTIGVLLAKLTQRNFVDSDLLIQIHEQRSLQEIVDTEGAAVLRQIEAEILRGLQVENHVIATGGSAVYSAAAMQHLRQHGTLIFLHVPLIELTRRVQNYATRGIAREAHQTLEDLFQERQSLYLQYADLVIDCAGLTTEEICTRILAQLPPVR